MRLSRAGQKLALELRNRLATMLYERMQLVRSAARYVFRRDPENVRRVTSAYQRQRVARYRKNRDDADQSLTTPGAPAAEPDAVDAPAS